MQDGSDSMEFYISVFEGGNVVTDVCAKEPGANDVVVGEVIAVSAGEGECFGDERGVWNWDSG